MGKKTILRAVAVGALAWPLAAPAQDTGGVVTTFGIEQRLSSGRNVALELPAEGRTHASDTTLSFGVTSATPLSRLSVAGGLTLRIADEPGGSITDIERPRLNFVYSREVADAVLELTGSYSRDRVEFLRDLSSFVGSDGSLSLPSDFGDLEGEGTRADYALGARLELGRTAPFGVVLEAGLSGEDYADTTAADLDDIRRTRLGASARLTFSPVTEGFVALRRETSDEDNAAETEITTDSLEVGLRQEVSPRARFEAATGYTRVLTEEIGLPDDEAEGLTARLGYEWDMRDGALDARLDTIVTEDGRRSTLSFGRERALPDGSLSGRIGVSRGELGDLELIGRLAWRRDLRDGGLSASLERSVRSTEVAAEAVTTTLALSFDRAITDVSGIAFGLDYAHVAETGEDDVTRAALSASYRHALTEDWALDVGLALRLRDEEAAGRSTSEEVFLSVSRDVTWRR